MPKLKSNRGAVKRFKKTASGGYKHKHAFRNHILTKMSTKSKRHLRSPGMVHASDLKSVNRMLTGS